MIRNYFITAYRNLKRNKIYALLNIAGLALGIGCATVIYKVIDYELSFDKHHSNYDNIYRVVRYNQLNETNRHDSGAAHPLGRTLRADFPMLKETATIDFRPSLQVSIKTESGDYRRFLDYDGVTFAEPNVFNILDFKWLAGNPETAIQNPNEVVLSAGWMEKFFGYSAEQANLAVGRVINLDEKKDLTVVGVYEDFPETTDFPFKMVVNYWTLDGFSRYFGGGERWNSVSSTTSCLVLLDDNTSPDDVERLLPDFLDKHIQEDESQRLTLLLQPMSDIHFSSLFYNYSERNMRKEILAALAIIGFVLVITACINFINLATAQAVKRSKEIGIRKVLGGYRGQLVWQFLSETFIITFFAVIVSLGVAEVLLVNLADILSYRPHLELISDPFFGVFLLGITLFVGLLSGLYPAFLLSKVEAVKAIKSKLMWSISGGFSLRRALVIFQFGISQLLIICTLVVVAQMDFFKSKELGFQTEAIILTYLPDSDPSVLDRLREGLASHPEVEAVSFGLSAPTGESNSFSNFNYAPANYEEQPRASFKMVDQHYIDLFGLELIEGRKLRKNDSSSIVINEEMVKQMGLMDPSEAIGENIRTGYDGERDGLNIVGVIRNFHSNSLARGLDNIVLLTTPKIFTEMAVKFNKGSLENARSIVEREWSTAFPTRVFDFDFYDEQLAQNYEAEQSNAELLTIFSIIAIFIGCLGLYGLVTFLANQKTKEIGVRKVLGASLTDILKIFTKELVVLMIVAFIIAAPIGFFSMESWLQNFEYKIALGPFIFVKAILATMIIALLTMGYRSIKAALANPSESLKDE